MILIPYRDPPKTSADPDPAKFLGLQIQGSQFFSPHEYLKQKERHNPVFCLSSTQTLPLNLKISVGEFFFLFLLLILG